MKGYAFDQSQRALFSSFDYFQTSQESPSKDVVLAGVDEAGRGPLAGPVVAAAVVLPQNPQIDSLNDSKALTEIQREKLFPQICSTAVAYSVSIVDSGTIDSLNILKATLQAMRECIVKLSLIPDLVLIDGNQKPHSGLPEKVIIKGDSLSASIMAASVLAKVTRDRIMAQAHLQYPVYGFDKHKGYGCRTHLEALELHGPCPLHRKSFNPLRTWLSQQKDLIPSN